jgi:hypothetical protein
LFNLRIGEVQFIVQREKKGKSEEEVMKSIPSILLGFCFRPYDDELIIGYLLRKIKGEALSWEGIVEGDIYCERSP